MSGLVAMGALFVSARWFVSAEPREIIRVLRWLGILAGVLVLGFLVSRGLWGAVFPLVMGAFLYYRRRARRTAFSGGTGARGTVRAGKSSEVRTATLRMLLDHDSGDLDGSVLAGQFEGRALGALSEDDLLMLLDECGRDDIESAQLLETYLDRRLGTDWRERHMRAASEPPSGQQGALSRDEAFAVLGLEPGASDSEIREAHHRLMKVLHPDQG
ncbi:MAG: J domain-containing protein, partial [Alphaproteobacteria bacterium]|nr:J domain-containing protein [Alphaproteobacteria bacterium]